MVNNDSRHNKHMRNFARFLFWPPKTKINSILYQKTKLGPIWIRMIREIRGGASRIHMGKS
jgi:hypothetical protein